MVFGFKLFFYVTVSCSKLQLLYEIRELLIKFICFLKILLINLLTKMFMKLAFLYDFFINFSSRFGASIISSFLLFIIIEASKVEIFMHLLEFFIVYILIEVHVIELIKLIYFLSFVSQSGGCLSILKQSKFRSSLGDFHHLIAFLLFEQSLFGISYFLDLFLLGC